MKTMFTFGIAFEIAGKDVIVIAHNAAMTVPVQSGYTVRIVPDLVEAGVKETKGGVKFPGKGPVNAILVVDSDFEEIQVRQLDSAWARVSLSRLKDGYDKEKLEELISKIDPDGEAVKLYAAVMDDELQILAGALLARFGELIAEVDTDALGEELKVIFSNEELAPAVLAE